MVANLDTNFKIKKNNINFEKINFLDGKSSIYANNILIDNKGVVKSFKDIKIKTFQNNKINNDFSITSKNGLNIKGKIYDSKNLNKIISSKNQTNRLKNLTSNISISLEKINTNFSKKLDNFNLIGKIEKGKFVKVNAKEIFQKINIWILA